MGINFRWPGSVKLQNTNKDNDNLSGMKELFFKQIETLFPDNDGVQKIIKDCRFTIVERANHEYDLKVTYSQMGSGRLSTMTHELVLLGYDDVMPDEVKNYAHWRDSIARFIDSVTITQVDNKSAHLGDRIVNYAYSIIWVLTGHHHSIS